MLPNQYQAETKKTEIYTDASNKFVGKIRNAYSADELDAYIKFLSLMYCTGKLNGESGEIAEAVFKAFRGEGGTITEELRQTILKELGDVQWYVARIADLAGFDLDEVMGENLKKLKDRQERGVLHGYGDER